MQQKDDLAFAVISDPGNVFARLMGSSLRPRKRCAQCSSDSHLELTQINADGTTALPWPATPIIDADRTSRWVNVDLDYSTRSEAGDIIAALDSLSL
jgi:hypothetical protein